MSVVLCCRERLRACKGILERDGFIMVYTQVLISLIGRWRKEEEKEQWKESGWRSRMMVAKAQSGSKQGRLDR